MKKQFFLLIFTIFLFSTAFADTGFTVENIQIRGLQGISRDTVLSYLPITVGDKVDDKQSAKIIQALYRTGFFNDVRLSRKNGTLVIDVRQQPIISHITVTGNKDIPTDKLMPALKKLGFASASSSNIQLLATCGCVSNAFILLSVMRYSIFCPQTCLPSCVSNIRFCLTRFSAKRTWGGLDL